MINNFRGGGSGPFIFPSDVLSSLETSHCNDVMWYRPGFWPHLSSNQVQEIADPVSGRNGNGSNRPRSQPGGRREEVEVEPRVAMLEGNGYEHCEDDNAGVPLHPSSVVSLGNTRGKDRARRAATSEFLGKEEGDATAAAAATLLQSKFRGYHARKLGAVTASIREREDRNRQPREREGEGGCSVLDLEV